MNTFKLALLQMHVAGGELQANLAHAEELITQAANDGAQVLLLPEALDLGWTHPSAKTLAGAIPGGEACTRMCAATRQHGVYICVGLTEQAEDEVYNAAVLINPSGEVISLHRKINELEIGHPCYAQGDRLSVAHTPLATFGVMICADAFVGGQPITRALGYMGAQVILSPCAWAVDVDYNNEKNPYGNAWYYSYKPVCEDFNIWIAGVSNVGPISDGPWKGRICIGNSVVCDNKGEQVLVGPHGVDAEAILYIDIKPQTRPTRGTGWRKLWDRRAKEKAEAVKKK
jgi:predicted amidohydrolase